MKIETQEGKDATPHWIKDGEKVIAKFANYNMANAYLIELRKARERL